MYPTLNSFVFLLNFLRVFSVYIIKKVHGYATKMFGDMCAIVQIFFYLCTILDGMKTNGS